MDSVNKGDKSLTESNNLLFCRACLATDEKLFGMQEHKLAEVFIRVTGIHVSDTTKLTHLCVWCAALMKRCAAFRAKCLRAEQCLQLLEGELTADSIRTIDRQANLLFILNQTDIEIVSVNSSVTPLVLEPIPIININDTNTEAVKKEIYMEIKSLNENKTVIVNENKIKNEPDYISDGEYESNKDIFEDIPSVILKSESEKVKTKNARKRAKSKREVKSKRKKDAEVPGGSEKKFKKRSAEDDYMPNMNIEEFKKNYDVDIFILTREAGPFECPVCKIGHRCKTTQMRHYDSHRFKFVCRQCGFVSRTRTQAKLHHAWHAGKKYHCMYCEKEFSKRSTWLGHVRTMHKCMNVVCDMCGETFVNGAGLKCHKVYEHGVATQKEFKSMECTSCAVTFMSLDALNKHKMAVEQHKMAAGEHEMAAEHGALHACLQCGDTFRAAARLAEHAGAEHPSCQECDSTFLNAESFAVHVRRKHQGAGDGRHERRARANARARSRGAPLPYPPPRARPPTRPAARGKVADKVCCEHCGKILSNPTMLSYHLRKHRGEKLPFACVICPKSFYIKQQLEHHIRVHTGEKPYKCEQCELAFTVKGNLTRHMRVVHMGIRRKTECSICGHFFATPFTMKMHVRTVHNGEPWPKRAPRKKKTQSLE